VEVRKLLAAAMLRTKATRPNSVPAQQQQQHDAFPSRAGSGMSIAQSTLSPMPPAAAPSPGASSYSQPSERIDPATFVIPEGVYSSAPGTALAQQGQGQRPTSEPTAGAAEAAAAAAAAAYAAAVSAGFSMSEEQLHQSRGEDAAAAALVQTWRMEQQQQVAGGGAGAQPTAGNADMQWA
jgi:hypothetical protein